MLICYTVLHMAFLSPAEIVRALELKAGEKVADFGAGAGHIAREAARAVGGGGEVCLIDIQNELLTKVKHIASPQELKAMRFIAGDLESADGSHLADASMDAVIAVNIFFQIEHKDECLREAARVLKPGGRLLLLDWQESFGGIGPQPEYVFTKEAALSLAQAIGLSFGHDIPAGDYHWGVLLRK